MRTALGGLLTALGMLLVLAGVFLAFDGKYGWRQFVSSFPSRMGSPDALYQLGAVGLLLGVGGLRLLLPRKGGDAPG